MRSLGVFLLLSTVPLLGCRSRVGGDAPAPEIQAAAPEQAAAATPADVAKPPGKKASLGEPAPDFTLSDLDGNRVNLASFKGKIVVLEWFNPDCPFVRASYKKGSLVGTAERQRALGVVWLTINSNAPGKQGAGKERNVEAKKTFGIQHSLLLDETGEVGKLYEAKTTPHLFVIDPEGKLVYRGGVDNSPDGEGESPKGGKLINYVDEAVGAVRAGSPIPNPDTEPYGCSVKYAN